MLSLFGKLGSLSNQCGDSPLVNRKNDNHNNSNGAPEKEEEYSDLRYKLDQCFWSQIGETFPQGSSLCAEEKKALQESLDNPSHENNDGPNSFFSPKDYPMRTL